MKFSELQGLDVLFVEWDRVAVLVNSEVADATIYNFCSDAGFHDVSGDFYYLVTHPSDFSKRSPV